MLGCSLGFGSEDPSKLPGANSPEMVNIGASMLHILAVLD